MSVLIKGMKMPSECEYCCFCRFYPENGNVWCNAKNIILKTKWKEPNWTHLDVKRPDWCPLAELPEKHGRLIDTDAAMKQWGLDKATKYENKTVEQQRFSYSTMMMYEIVDILDDAPVLIEAEGEG